MFARITRATTWLLVAAILGLTAIILTHATADAQTTTDPDGEYTELGFNTNHPDPDAPSVVQPKIEPNPEVAAEDPSSDTDVYIAGEGEVTTQSHTSTLRSCGNGFTITHDESQFMQLVNNKRAQQGNQRMCVDRRLMRSSQDWTNYLASRHDFYHGGLPLICNRYNYCGYDKAFENIGYRSDRTHNPVAMFKAYLASNEGHREALLGANRDRIGTAWRGNDRGDDGYSFNTVHLSNHPNE